MTKDMKILEYHIPALGYFCEGLGNVTYENLRVP